MSKELISLMEENLVHVWSQRNASERIKSIQTIYSEDSGLYHIGHQTKGFEAINNSVSNVVANMPKDFIFFKLKPVTINNNIGRLIWGLGPNAASIVATGMDIAVFEDGKIKSLYVFLD
ncbi:hypothetical protein J2X31_002126 [Flavobacterium arsenatis]|uniref:Nuclear transport factor 2 family protein n=1 Tax=Flavobacterium arsenatis TaxID=1484332 RepID=A0ABU1TQD1_9FLAO|nr:nuclear transport factor 2 family protein [Flavobacterium arsenatis]MDR6968111.1 hypothetical protein [Flavobacterium arsenatis]